MLISVVYGSFPSLVVYGFSFNQLTIHSVSQALFLLSDRSYVKVRLALKHPETLYPSLVCYP